MRRRKTTCPYCNGQKTFHGGFFRISDTEAIPIQSWCRCQMTDEDGEPLDPGPPEVIIVSPATLERVRRLGWEAL